MPNAVELRKELEAKQQRVAAIFEEAGNDLDFTKVKSLDGDTAAKVAAVKALNAELNDLGQKLEAQTELENIAKAAKGFSPFRQPAAEPGERSQQRKSFGELFTDSAAFKTKGATAELDIDLKTLFQTSAGWLPETTRTGRIVEFAVRPIQVTDIVPQTTTGQAAVVYMEETTFTNNAAEVAEAGTYAESAFALTEKSSTVKKIGTFIPVTDEQLEDVTQVQGYLNNRLQFSLRQRLDGQILNGNGTGANLLGVLNTPGIQTQAKAADPIPDAVYKAMVKVRVTGRAVPNAIIMHPTDWQSVRLLKTADGIYIWGSPSEAVAARLWGLPVAECDALSQGTSVLGDWANFSELSVRRGIEVQISNSHSTYFIEGKQAMRADMRAALVFYRPAAFCTVTGL